MTGLLQQVQRTIRREALLPAGARLLIGLSGGADSVALTLLLLDLSAHDEFQVAALAHLNHRLRPTSDRDEQFCRDLARTLGLEIVVDQADVAGYAATQRLSVEDAARRVRYEFLERAAARMGADRIAVGHTLEDQAETVVLKLIRGAGLTGLAGISPRKQAIVRPLLEVSKTELRAYLQSRGQTWMEDESNADLSNPRNRVRHRILPELELAYPGATRAIARSAEIARNDGDWLDSRARTVLTTIATTTEGGLELEAGRLAGEPPPIVRRVLLMALRAISGNREIGLDHIRVAEEVLAGDRGGADLPGIRLELRRKTLVLSRQGPHRSDTLTG